MQIKVSGGGGVDLQTIQSKEENQSQKRAHTKNQLCLHCISGNHML